MGSFGRAIKLWAANQAMKLCLVATIARLWITKSKELANISRAGGIPQWGDPKVPTASIETFRTPYAPARSVFA